MALSPDLRRRILAHVDGGHSKQEAAEKYEVHRTTVGRLLERRGQGKPLKADEPKGRKRKIQAEQAGLLRAQVAAHHDDTLEQHCERWAREQGVRLSVTGMYCSLERYELTKKKTLKAVERDEAERQRWREQHQTRPVGDWVFLDGSGTHVAMTPPCARSPSGQGAYGEVPRNRGHDISLITTSKLAVPAYPA